MSFKFSMNAEASMEAAAPFKQSVPAFSQINDIHQDLLRTAKDLKAYAIDFSEYSCSRCTYAIFVREGGGMFSKGEYKFAENLSLTKDAFMALRQFYYMMHAALYNQIFNYVTIFVEAKDDKVVKVGYSAGYDKNMDSVESASHAAPSNKMGSKLASRSESIKMGNVSSLKFS